VEATVANSSDFDKTQRIISDTEWTELKRLSGLPVEARVDIEDTLAFYRKYSRIEADLPPPASLQEDLRDMAKKARRVRLMASLFPTKLEKFKAFSSVFPGEDAKSKQEAAKKILSAVEQVLATLSERLDAAAAQTIGPGKTGRKKSILWITINALNVFLFHYTRKKLNRVRRYTIAGEGTAEFAIRALKLADKNLTDTKILNAIKNHVEPFAKGYVDLLDDIVRLIKEADTAMRISFYEFMTWQNCRCFLANFASSKVSLRRGRIT
jgi:hypothetical protein